MKKPTFFHLLFALPFLCVAQWQLYSDFYIAPGTEFHLVSDVSFQGGSFLTDHGAEGGVLSMAAGSQWHHADHNAHVDGNVRVYAPTAFYFPVGHDNVLQPLTILEASGVGMLTVDYRHVPHRNLTPGSGLIKIHPAHYWNLQPSSGTAKVRLSWNEFSNLSSFLDGQSLRALTIVGYKSEAWEKIPANIDSNNTNTLLSGTLVSATPVALSDYSALALAAEGIAGTNGNAEDLPAIAEGISPNGDGVNDTWHIAGIERFPKAEIYVYNRVGEIVFQATNGYNNDWRGDFKDSGNTLPSGPYFYSIDLDDDGQVDMQGWLYIQQ